MQYKQQIYKIPWRHAKERRKKDEKNKEDIRNQYREREVRVEGNNRKYISYFKFTRGNNYIITVTHLDKDMHSL